MDYVLVTPELPANLSGVVFAQGLEAFRENSGTIQSFENSQSFPDYGSDFFDPPSGGPAVDYFKQSCFMYEGSQENNPVYSTKNSADTFYEILELSDTRLGPRLNRNGNAGYLSAQNYDGTYTFDADYVDSVDSSTGSKSNLGRLLDEWYRMGGAGMEGLECNFIFDNSTGPRWVDWPDTALQTSCVLGAYQSGKFLPSSMSYDVSSDLSFSGMLIDRDAGVSIVDNDKEEEGSGTPITATIDGRIVSTGGSGGVSTGDLQDSKDDTDLLAIFISRN